MRESSEAREEREPRFPEQSSCPPHFHPILIIFVIFIPIFLSTTLTFQQCYSFNSIRVGLALKKKKR